MNKTSKNIIKTLLFVSLGFFLFYLVYKDFDFSTLIYEFSTINYWWFLPMLTLSILSHVSRAIRWQMLLDSQGPKTRFLNTFMAVMNGYFANIAIPRLGEVTRCGIVSKYDNKKFSNVLGTMISERLVDIFMLILITILAFILQANEIKEFISNNPELGKNLDKFATAPVIGLIIFLGLLLIAFTIYIAKGKLNHVHIFKKLSDFIHNFWQGIISLKKVKKPFLFIFHTVLIWVLYFFVLYLGFFAFEDIKGLGILAGLTLFIAGSYGMVAPAPNGVGAYHFMTIQALLIYGISMEKAASFALIIHGLQTLFLIVAGLISFIVIPIINKNRTEINLETEVKNEKQ